MHPSIKVFSGSNDIYNKIISYLKNLGLKEINVKELQDIFSGIKFQISTFPKKQRDSLEKSVEGNLSKYFNEFYTATFLNRNSLVKNIKQNNKKIQIEYTLFLAKILTQLDLLATCKKLNTLDVQIGSLDLGSCFDTLDTVSFAYKKLIEPPHLKKQKYKEIEALLKSYGASEELAMLLDRENILDTDNSIDSSGSSNIWVNKLGYEDYLYQWSIFIKFSGENFPTSKIHKFIWAFSETLESISGIHIETESIGMGSLWLRFKAFIKTPEAKKEAIDLLQKSRDALTSQYLNKPVVDNEKTEAETRKINAEAGKYEKELALIPNEEYNKKKQELELRKLEAEVRRAEADAKKAELENIEKSVNVFKQLGHMIKEGMLSADAVSIFVNDKPYLTSEKGKLIEGSTLEAIDAAGVINPNNAEGEIKD